MREGDAMTLDLEIRKKGIGSSEIGAVLGLNPYTSAYDVWLEKTGQVDPWQGNERTRLGKRLEVPILMEYEERTGSKLDIYTEKTFAHPERPWQLATPDALHRNRPGIVEAKLVGTRMLPQWGEAGTDQVPEYYLVQGCWQMSVLDRSFVHYAILAGDQFRIYMLLRDRELEEMLIDRVDAFWRNNVIAGAPPEIRATERTLAWIKSKYRQDSQPLRVATAEETELMEDYRAVRAATEELQGRMDDLEAELKLAVGDSEGIAGPGFKLTWKKSRDSHRTNWESVALGLKDRVTDEEWDTLLSVQTTVRTGSRIFLPKWSKRSEG
jgi:putative phage-type endonuclease